MWNTRKDFILRMLTESSKETVASFIKDCDLPLLLERTLTERYIEDLGEKQQADRHNVDERTVRRWLAEAKALAVEKTLARIQLSYK